LIGTTDRQPSRAGNLLPGQAPRALVLGATGHIGNAILRELLERGYRVTGTRRGDGKAPNLAGLPIGLIAGDDATPGLLEDWIGDHDLVVDAAAPYPLSIDWRGEHVRTALRRGERIIQACQRSRAHLAYVSSFVTERAQNGFERLEDRIPRMHSYFRIKEKLEEQVLQAGRAGLATTIVAPTMCVGPWDQKRRRFCMIPNILTVPVAVYTPHQLNVVDVRDVAVALVSAVERGEPGQRIIVSGRNISMDQLYRFIMELGGVCRRMVGIPLGDCVLGAFNLGAALGSGDTPQKQVLLSALLTGQYRPMFPGADQIALGAAPRPLSRTLTDAIDWYRRIGYC
jgi:dihydroflavonol-4-reductase